MAETRLKEIYKTKQKFEYINAESYQNNNIMNYMQEKKCVEKMRKKLVDDQLNEQLKNDHSGNSNFKQSPTEFKEEIEERKREFKLRVEYLRAWTSIKTIDKRI